MADTGDELEPIVAEQTVAAELDLGGAPARVVVGRDGTGRRVRGVPRVSVGRPRLVVEDVEAADGRLEPPAFAERTFDPPADEEALAALAIDGELVASKRECRAAAVDDAAAENGPAGLVEQIALDRASATRAALVRERHAAVPRSSVEADLRLCKLRSDASAAGIAEVAHGHAALVDGGEGAVDGDLS